MLHEKIKKQRQEIARYEKSLSLEHLKKRRADTRRKIELGGLVIKSGADGFNKFIILGALDHAVELIHKENQYRILFEARGNKIFNN